MLNGWIKLHRKTLNNWVSQEPEMLAVWLRLLLEANHSDTKNLFNGVLIEIKRGQLIFGLNAFSSKSGVSVAKLRRYLNMLKADSMIDKQTTSKYSIITITSFDQYQLDDNQNTSKQQSNDKQIANKQQHRKNVKNEEECKEEDIGAEAPAGKQKKSKAKNYKTLDYSSWPSMPDEYLLADWMTVRRDKKASNTQTAINSIGSQLHKAVTMGYTVDQCIRTAATKPWRGFEAEWMGNSGVAPENKPTESSGKSKFDSIDYGEGIQDL